MSNTPTPSADLLLIGAHTSASGGVQYALKEGTQIGASAIQLFTANQRRWDTAEIDEKTLLAWQKTREESGIHCVMSHDSYLINLGCPDPMNLEKSQKAFEREIQRCLQLEIPFLNFHPGAALENSTEACLDKIVESLLLFHPLLEHRQLRLLLETTAGQGSQVGHSFEQLSYILERAGKELPLGVCVDTCHIFAAGYDIRDQESWNKTWKTFDRLIGLPHLYAFHVNDSLRDLGTRVDRHAPLGEGKIGLEAFRLLMQDPRMKSIPKFLETPGGPPLWQKEIQLLRSLAK